METKVILSLICVVIITGCSVSKDTVKPEEQILTSVINKLSGNNGPYTHLIQVRILAELGAVSEKFSDTLKFNESISAKHVLNVNNLENILQIGRLPDNLNEMFSEDKDKNINFEPLNDNVDLILELSGENGTVVYTFKKKDGEWLLLNKR